MPYSTLLVTVCSLVMFGMAAAGYFIIADCVPGAIAWAIEVLLSIGGGFVALDRVGLDG